MVHVSTHAEQCPSIRRVRIRIRMAEAYAVKASHANERRGRDAIEAVEVEGRSGGEGLGRALNDLGNAYVAAGDMSNTIEARRSGGAAA